MAAKLDDYGHSLKEILVKVALSAIIWQMFKPTITIHIHEIKSRIIADSAISATNTSLCMTFVLKERGLGLRS